MARIPRGMKGHTEHQQESGSYVLIDSYHDLDRIGWRTEGKNMVDVPLDSVIDTKTKQIVGYGQGSTFSREGLGKISPHMKSYEVLLEDEETGYSEPYHIAAINPRVAAMIRDKKFNGQPPIYEVTTKRKAVS